MAAFLTGPLQTPRPSRASPEKPGPSLTPRVDRLVDDLQPEAELCAAAGWIEGRGGDFRQWRGRPPTTTRQGRRERGWGSEVAPVPNQEVTEDALVHLEVLS